MLKIKKKYNIKLYGSNLIFNIHFSLRVVFNITFNLSTVVIQTTLLYLNLENDKNINKFLRKSLNININIFVFIYIS